MKKSFKTAALYIGTAIGAGFSSGREIALFFGDSSPLNVAISSVFMSLLCALFLIAGKNHLMPKGKIVNLGIFTAASISLCSMLAGGDYIMSSLTGIPLAFGLVMTILGGVIVVLGIEKIRLLNAVLVPMIVLSILLIFTKLPTPLYSLPFSISKPILYSGLDVLLGGVIVSEEGENMSYKEILLSCLMICGFMFGMLYMLQTVVLSDVNDSLMPVLAISERLHLKPVCGVLIAAAIFTTLVSSLKIVSDRVQKAMSRTKKLAVFSDDKHRYAIVFLCLVLAYPLSFFGFDNIVDNLYPFNRSCGVILTALTIVKLIVFIVKTAKEKHAQKRANNSLQSNRIDTECVTRDDDSSHHHNRSRVRDNDNRNRHSRDRGNRSLRHRNSNRRHCHNHNRLRHSRHNRNLRLHNLHHRNRGGDVLACR